MSLNESPPLLNNAPTYEQLWNPDDYLNRIYSTVEGHTEEHGINTFMFKHLHRVFHEEGLCGHRLIDIGTGPVICNVAQACQNFDEVILSDYAANSRETLRKWVGNEPGCFDWKPFFKYMCQLEGHSDVDAWEKKVRQSIKDVIYSDVHKPNPLAPKSLPAFDCVTSSYCLETACKTKQQYSQAVCNVGNILRNGGTFIQLAIPLKFYMVNGKSYDGLVADENFFKSALIEAGFTNIELHVLDKTAKSGDAISYDFSFFARATKG